MDVVSTNNIANLNEFISEKFKLIPKSIIKPIIHCTKNAPIKINKLKDVRAFPALDSEKAIPTAGCVNDKNTELTINIAQWIDPAFDPKKIIIASTIKFIGAPYLNNLIASFTFFENFGTK